MNTPEAPAPDPKPKLSRTSIVLAVLIVAAVIVSVFAGPLHKTTEYKTGQIVAFARSHTLSKLVFHPADQVLTGVHDDGGHNVEFQATYLNDQEKTLAELFDSEGISYEVASPKSNFWVGLAGTLLQMLLLLLALWWLLIRNGPGSSVLKSGSKHTKPVDRPAASFADLGGVDEAIVELAEVVQYLSDAESFTRLGAKPPRGVLLQGPPGTGKTALARATAGEANVPFFSLSGSEFVEMFVGVGAGRVRALFEQARKHEHAIVFIDEIDAVGRSRGASIAGGGGDEREQTLNQLLVEFDGFDASDGIVLIAATNRPDILDPALLRRFDRQITVPLPNRAGRRAILAIHTREKPLASDVDLESIAAQTVQFSGDQLERCMNEAAMLATRESVSGGGDGTIHQRHMERALERILLGPERRSGLPGREDLAITAYHEAGHTLVAHLLQGARRPHKVSIIPRGGTGGATWMLPPDRVFLHVDELRAHIVVAMGGRAGEEVLLDGNVTTGAEHDLKAATQIATEMVTRYGFGSVGPVYLHKDTMSGMGAQAHLSEQTRLRIEEEVSAMVLSAQEFARQVVADNDVVLKRLVAALLDEETVDADRLAELFGEVEPGTCRWYPPQQDGRET